MRIFKIIVLVLCLSAVKSFAQIDLSAGMGINFSANSSLYDFLSTNHKTGPGDQSFTFASNIEFYSELTYPVAREYEAGLEYDYSIYSYSSTYGIQYDLTYNMHSFTLSGYYVLKGSGYKFRFGGGAGYRYMLLQEKFENTRDFNYTLNGAGIQFKADGNTSLGGNLYANIGLILRFDYLGKPKGTTAEQNAAPITNVKFFIISPGLRLGVSYFF